MALHLRGRTPAPAPAPLPPPSPALRRGPGVPPRRATVRSPCPYGGHGPHAPGPLRRARHRSAARSLREQHNALALRVGACITVREGGKPALPLLRDQP
ncbi:hypothetical protein D7Y27_22350 [Corallococcus sp. AB004]|nr:hypothetical protein D7Y27_22350 [Corallococcus sp. AB004]